MKKSISILFCLFMFPLFLNTSQVNAQSSVPSCLSFKSGDHAARIECFKNNDNAYQAIINELMATEVGSAVDYNNEAQRFQESTTEGQHIQQQEAKVSDLERQISQLLKEKEADRK